MGDWQCLCLWFKFWPSWFTTRIVGILSTGFVFHSSTWVVYCSRVELWRTGRFSLWFAKSHWIQEILPWMVTAHIVLLHRHSDPAERPARQPEITSHHVGILFPADTWRVNILIWSTTTRVRHPFPTLFDKGPGIGSWRGRYKRLLTALEHLNRVYLPVGTIYGGFTEFVNGTSVNWRTLADLMDIDPYRSFKILYINGCSCMSMHLTSRVKVQNPSVNPRKSSIHLVPVLGVRWQNTVY